MWTRHAPNTDMDSHLAGLVCALVGIAAYLNSLDCGFCFDDISAIKENKDLRPESPWSNLIWNDFWGTPMHVEGSHKSYRPLCVLTFRINYLIHGLQPFGYHAGNVLLHGLVCYVFVLVCALGVFNRYSSGTLTLLAGLSFAVHPIHTEAVAGVVGRAECLSALFFLLTFLAYKRSIHQQHTRSGWLVFSLFLCVCSVLSKEQGVTVIALCLCYDFFIVHKNDFGTSLLLMRSLFSGQPKPSWWTSFLFRVAAMMSFLVMVMFVRVKIMHDRLPVFTVHDNPAVALTTPYRQLHWMYLIFTNCWLLLDPSTLCADWTMGTIPLIQSIADPRNMLTLVTFVVFAGAMYYSMSGNSVNQQVTFFALMLMIFPFLPASNLFFPVGFVVAERILYVPSMGFSILFAMGACKMLNSRLRKLAILAVICLLVSHTFKTLERNRDWHSDLTLFTSAVHTNPENGKIYNNLGHVYEHNTNYSLAEEMFRRAADKQPDDVGAYINLGRVLKAQLRYSEAEKAYMKAVDLIPKEKTFRIAPGHINVFYNLGNLVKLDDSRLNEALLLYNKALSMKPDFVEAHMNKADTLLKLNQSDQALSSYQSAVRYGPGNPDTHYNLGTVYLNKGDLSNAQKCYQRVLSLNNQHKLALFNMGLLLIEKKTPDALHQAAQMFKHLVQLQPDNDRAHFQLGMAYIEVGEFELGKQSLEQVLIINPTYRSALYNLGLLLYQEKLYSRVLDLLTVLRQHHPGHVGGMQLLGDTLTQLKRYREAKEAYLLSLHYNPNHVTAIHNLGVVMAELGDYRNALKQFARTLQLDPHHKTALKHMQGAQKMMAEAH